MCVIHKEVALDEGGKIPTPGKLSDHLNNSEFTGWLWAVVEIDGTLLDDLSKRVNISVPRRILTRIDRYASAHGESCSGFLVNAALHRIIHDQS